MKLFYFLVCATLLLLPHHAMANTPAEKPYYYFTEQQMADIKGKAAHGDVDALKQLAISYLKGFAQGQQLVQHPDDKEAFKYFEQAAKTGDAWSQTYVGWFYDNGRAVDRDYNTALKWYRLAEAQGFPAAQDLIGRMYRDGHGVPKSYPLAAEMFKKAALQFYISAPIHLGNLYFTGGPEWPQDYEKAFFWLDFGINDAWPKAASKNDELCCEAGDTEQVSYTQVRLHLTPAQIEKIQKQVKDYKMPPPTKWSPPGLPMSLPPSKQAQ